MISETTIKKLLRIFLGLVPKFKFWLSLGTCWTKNDLVSRKFFSKHYKNIGPMEPIRIKFHFWWNGMESYFTGPLKCDEERLLIYRITKIYKDILPAYFTRVEGWFTYVIKTISSRNGRIVNCMQHKKYGLHDRSHQKSNHWLKSIKCALFCR